MSNKQLPAEVQERIKADAESAITKNNEVLLLNESYNEGYEDGYIAGGTAEEERAQSEIETLKSDFKRVQKTAIDYANRKDEVVKQRDKLAERAQVLVDALEELLNMMPKGDGLRYFHAREQVLKGRQLLQQWKRKGVENG